MLRQNRRRRALRSSAGRIPNRRRSNLGFEQLESRQLLAVADFAEKQVLQPPVDAATHGGAPWDVVSMHAAIGANVRGGDSNNDGHVNAADYVLLRKFGAIHQASPDSNSASAAAGSASYNLFVQSFGVATAFPTPLLADIPLGSLIHEGSEVGSIDNAGDTRTFSLLVDPGQTLTVVVEASAGLRPAVEIRNQDGAILGSATAAAAGEEAVVQTVPTHGQLGENGPPPRTYFIVVSGLDDTVGAYTVRTILNAAVEEESHGGPNNNATANAQNLYAAFLPLHGSVEDSDGGRPDRAAVLGQIDGPAGDVIVDGYGYTAFAVPFEFDDISATGTSVLSSGDDVASFVDIGFTFNFYGTDYASLFVSSNGLITFDSSNADYTNGNLSSYPFQASIAPFWDDLYIGNVFGTATVKSQVIGPAGSRQLVIQWDGIVFYSGGDFGDPITFQAVLSEGTGRIQFNYLDLASDGAFGNDGRSATVGIKDVGVQGSNRLLLAQNDGPNAFIGTGQSTRIEKFQPTPDFYSFTLAAGESATLAAKAEAGGNVTLELQDAAGNSLALAHGNAENIDALISNFVAPSTGTYYARVGGDFGTNYSLLVTRNADFDAEANNSLDTAQDLIASLSAGRRWVLGEVGDLSASLGNVSFDELLPQPVDGLSIDGVSFGFKVGGVPSFDATFGAVGPGQVVYVQDPSLEGNAAGNLTLDFDSPTSFLQFGVVLSTFASLADGVTVQLFDPALNLISTTSLATQNEGFGYSEGQFTHDGALVSRAVLDFNELAALRFAFDNLVFNSPATTDFYRITVDAQKMIEIQTRTPGRRNGEFVNELDPMIRLYREDGTLVAQNDNGDSNGRDALLRYRVPRGGGGTYYIEVLPSVATDTPTEGEYILSVKQANGTLEPFKVSAASIDEGARLRGPVTEITLDFSDTILLTSLDASDLTVNGVAATAFTVIDSNTVTFSLPAIGEGFQTLEISAGAIHDVQNSPLQPYALQFYHDLAPPSIVAVNVQQGDVLAPGDLTYVVEFSEEMQSGNLDLNDFLLRGEFSNFYYSPSSVSYDANGTILSISYSSLPEDRYYLYLFSSDGAFEDLAGWNLDGEPLASPLPPNVSGDGFEGGDYYVDFHLDLSAAAFPTPLAPKSPLGSLIYDPTVSGLVGFVGDTDSYTLNVDAGQTITVLVDPASTLQSFIEVRDSFNAVIGSASSGAAGNDTTLQSIAVATAGTYTITVGGAGSSLGAYSLQVILNAALERESHNGPTNDTLATAQSINASFLPLLKNASRGAVLGNTDLATGYTAAAVPFTFANITATGTSVLTGGDDVSAFVDIGFTFNFYGVGYSSLFVSSNGLITFGSPNSEYVNSDLTFFPNQATIAPFWDDLYVGNGFGTAAVKTQVTGPVGNRQLIIQWDRLTFYSGSNFSDPITFQAVLSEATGSILFTYQDLFSGGAFGNNGASATVGIKAAGAQGPQRLLLAFNNGGNAFVGAGQSTRISPAPPPADLYSFTVADGDRATLSLTSQSGGNVDLALLDAGGNVLATGVVAQTNVDEMVYDFGPLAVGTYFARVSGDANVDYSLIVLRNAVFDREGNDTLATAQPFGGTQVALGHLGVSDVDHYSFTSSAGATIDLFTATPGDGPGEIVNTLNPRLRLFDPAGILVASGTILADGRNESILYTVPVAGGGTYTVVVDAEGGTSGEYVLDPTTEINGTALESLPDAQSPTATFASRAKTNSLSSEHFIDLAVQTRTTSQLGRANSRKASTTRSMQDSNDHCLALRPLPTAEANSLRFVDEAFDEYNRKDRSGQLDELAADLSSVFENLNEPALL